MNRTKSVLFLLLSLFLSLGTLALAQGDGSASWRVASATPIELPEGAPPLHYAFPAPDGRHIGYYTRTDADGEMMCSMDVVTGETTCVPLPGRFGLLSANEDLYWSARWSLDSTRMALVGQPLIYLRDTDLSIVDFENGTSSVLIGDDFEDSMLSDELPPTMSIESQPVWSPDGTQVAIERTVPGDESIFADSVLSLVDVATGEITELSLLPGSDTVENDAGSIIGMDWSPDGTTLAVSITHRSLEPNYDGLWLVDVENGRFERLVTLGDATDAYLEISPGSDGDIRFLSPVSWSPDGSRLLFWAADPNYAFTIWPCWVDVESGEVTPVPLPSHANDQTNYHVNYPLQVLWSPDGMILVLSTAREDALPDDETLMPLDPALADQSVVSVQLLDPTTGESTLLGHLPLYPAKPGWAAWGPDGNVIVNGYHLEMTNE